MRRLGALPYAIESLEQMVEGHGASSFVLGTRLPTRRAAHPQIKHKDLGNVVPRTVRARALDAHPWDLR